MGVVDTSAAVGRSQASMAPPRNDSSAAPYFLGAGAVRDYISMSVLYDEDAMII